jgi:hypothetical protein
MSIANRAQKMGMEPKFVSGVESMFVGTVIVAKIVARDRTG